MAHFAKIEDNIVTQVIVVPDNAEDRGQDYLANDLGLGGTWVQTSYNARIRKNYAGVGFTYDSVRDAFIAPKPFNSWELDEETCKWEPPIPKPFIPEGYHCTWLEETVNWYVHILE